MKTPRELLMERYRSVEHKLNVIREEVIGDLSRAELQSEKREGVQSGGNVVAFCREFLRPFSLNASGLVFLWLVILAFRLTTPDSHELKMAKLSSPPPEILAQQQRLLAELAELEWMGPVEPPKPVAPRPRSERRCTSVLKMA